MTVSSNANKLDLAARVLAGESLDDLPNQHFIDGQWHASDGGSMLDTFDPGSAEVWHQVSAGTATDAEQAVESSQRAFLQWRNTTPAQRAEVMQNAARLIGENAERLAVIESLDCGKSLVDAEWDIGSVQKYLNYYAGAADKLEGDTIPLGPDMMSFNILEPVGVTTHIIPWNYPISTMFRGIAPALAAGCTTVVKPAETTSVSALVVAELLSKAGLPDGVCNVVTGFGAEVGAPLCQHPDVRHVTFTGSVPTGSAVMGMAAKNIASVTLELGGKSPAVVLADADIEAAAEDLVMAIYENAGQVCSAGSRLVIHRSVHQQFLEVFMAKARQLTIGHALRRPDVAAINSAQQLSKITGYVDGAKARDLEILMGGNVTTDPVTGKGWFFEPTLINDVPHEDCIVQEEIFGPVLAVQLVDSDEQALAYANGTDFGLAACVYTKDVTKALRMARDFDAGIITINQYFAGGVSTPFGGNKKSGFGREKGLEALRAYCRVKSITAKI